MRVEMFLNVGNNPVEVTNSKKILGGKKKVVGCSRTIVYDIILCYSNK